MKLTWARRLAAGLVLLALAAPLHGQSFGFPWWKDAQFQKDLSLTTDQSARIDSVFQSTMTAPPPEEGGAGPAGGGAFAADRGERRRGGRHPAGGQGRRHSRQPQQDAHADAAADAAGADAGAARPTEQAARAVGQGSPAAQRRRNGDSEEVTADLRPGHGETSDDTERNDLDAHGRDRPGGIQRRHDPGAAAADLRKRGSAS